MTIDARWAKRELWTLVEAAQLVAGLEPISRSLVGDSARDVERLILDDGLRSSFHELYEASKSAFQLGKLNCLPSRTGALGNKRVKPSDFIAWAHGRGYPIPNEFASLLSAPAYGRPGEKIQRLTAANSRAKGATG